MDIVFAVAIGIVVGSVAVYVLHSVRRVPLLSTIEDLCVEIYTDGSRAKWEARKTLYGPLISGERNQARRMWNRIVDGFVADAKQSGQVDIAKWMESRRNAIDVREEAA